MNRSSETIAALGVLVLALTLALASAPSGGVWSATATAAAGAQKKNKKAKPRALYWGAWIGDQITGVNPPFDMGGVQALQNLVGKGLSLVEFSSPFYDCGGSSCTPYRFPTVAMQNTRDYGAIPVFSWGSDATSSDSSEFQLAAIAGGKYDAYVSEFAEEARAWGHPFFLRFNWEMNGNWFPWSVGVNGNTAADYVAAWRHIHDIFTSVGATNATWVWCPYSDAHRSLKAIKAVYPGGAYVDWTCLDGYNWGRNGVNPQPWRTFDEIFQKRYAFLTQKVARRKPVLLAELASSPNGGHKALWIREMLHVLPKRYPRVRGLVWLDSYDRGINWPIETSGTAVTAFARGIGNRIYRANRYGELDESPIPPPR